MSKTVRFVLSALLIVSLVQPAFTADVTAGRIVKETGKPAVLSVLTGTESVTVVSVDQTKRIVRLRTSDGESESYKVGKEVRNLAQLKKGDVLTARATRRVAIYVRQGRERPAFSESFVLARAPKGAKPGFVATEKVKISGKVQLVQVAKRRVVITGPAGRTKAFDVAPDVKNLKQVKAGDVVAVDYTETLSITTASPKK